MLAVAVLGAAAIVVFAYVVVDVDVALADVWIVLDAIVILQFNLNSISSRR